MPKSPVPSHARDALAGIAALLRMDDRTWRRHANPWSVWTRIPIGPALILALYARAWIGWWCLAPVAALVAWIWINPRAFPEPARLDSWASRAVLGERILLARTNRPVPRHHLTAAGFTTAVAVAGLPPTIYGLVALDPWATAFGGALTVLGKLWFVDRMVWLHDETQGFPGRPG